MGLFVFLKLLGDYANRREDVGEPDIHFLRQFLCNAVNLLVEINTPSDYGLKLA